MIAPDLPAIIYRTRRPGDRRRPPHGSRPATAPAPGVNAKLPVDRVTAAFIATHPGCSHGSLHRWHRAFRAVGLEGLVDGRALRARPKAEDPFLEEVKRVWLTPGRCFKLPVCINYATVKATENGWPVRSVSACRRAINAIPKGVAIKFRQGNEAFVNQAEPYITRDYSTLVSNEVWCGDHHCFDVWVRAPGNRLVRPWLTAWEDVRSRFVPGWVIAAHDPNSDTILEAFRAGVLEHGVPDVAYIDNGRDYKAQVFSGKPRPRPRPRMLHVEHDVERLGGVFQSLGVSKCHATPYHPQSKPIERFFGTVEERFGKLWPTYCGDSPDTRPEDLGERLKDAPTLDQFIASFREWLRDDYHARPHFGDAMEGKTPAAVYAACLEKKRTADPRLLDLLCLRPSKPVTVTRQGVRFDGLVYGDHALFRLVGQKVTLRVDDRDRTAVHVFTVEGRFVCLAQAVAKLPFLADSAMIREAHAIKGRARRQAREYRRAGMRSLETLPETMLRAAAEKARQQPPPPQAKPGVIQPIRSELEGELKAIDRAKRLRLAAGAESMADSVSIWDTLRKRMMEERTAHREADLSESPPLLPSMTDLVKNWTNGGSDGSEA